MPPMAPLVAPRTAAPPRTPAAAQGPSEKFAGEWLGRSIRARRAIFIFSFGAFVVLLLLGIGLAIWSSANSQAERAEQERQVAAGNAERQKVVDKIRADQAKEEADNAHMREADISRIKSQSLNMGRPQRDEWIRSCVAKGTAGGCGQWQVDAMIAGAPEKERLRAERVSFAESVERAAREHGEDGTKVSGVPVGIISALVERDNLGLPMLELVPSTSLAEAKKDPDAARGKRVRVAGSIIEIRVSGGSAEGALMTDGMTVVRLYSTMSTSGVFDGGWASFVGVFVQEYDYPNVSGGVTRSYLLVGAFDIPENRQTR